MLAIARDRGSRRHRAISATRHDQLGAGIDLDRLRRAVGIPEILVTAGRTLRAVRHVMLGDGGAHQIEAGNVIAQIGAEAGGEGLGDFDCGELDRALSERVLDQRRLRYGLRLRAIEKSLDLAVADHAVGQASPAGALTWPEYWPNQRE